MAVLIFAGTFVSPAPMVVLGVEQRKYFVCTLVPCGHVHNTCMYAVGALKLKVKLVQGFRDAEHPQLCLIHLKEITVNNKKTRKVMMMLSILMGMLPKQKWEDIR